MNNIHTLIFSKDRPLQLDACLSSFQFYTDGLYNTTVITPTPEQYHLMKNRYISVKWIDEREMGGFGLALGNFLNSIPDKDTVLLCVDDLVWLRPFNLSILSYVHTVDNCLGFSLRLGTNIYPYNPSWNLSANRIFSIIDWRDKPHHYGYAFDVSCSGYTARLLKEIVSNSGSKIRIPNDLESVGCRFAYSNSEQYRHLMFMNSYSFAGCCDLNRVQDLYQNKVNGDAEHSAQELTRLYKEGRRIRWEEYYNFVPRDCFFGKERFCLV